jgi:dTDP-4-amino-4,6-dideoxygalactose transaminase/CelD/BcsL family acetyltransferase involved in cellulose biosynthesis
MRASPSRLTLGAGLPLDVYTRSRAKRLPFPLEEAGYRLFARARHGLRLGVQELGLGPGDEVLVPAYHHGSEIEALVRAGLTCRFYDLGTGLEPEEEELDSLLTERTRALHLIHYFGLPQDAQRWRSWCDERNLMLIEDAAQSWLASVDGRPVGSFGSLAIFCVYKTFALPDGGAVVSASPPDAPIGRNGSVLLPLARHRLAVARRTGVLARSRRFTGTEHVNFALDQEPRPPSPVTLALLPRVADHAAAGRRRANYRLLNEDLGGLMPPAIAPLGDGASPLVFPVWAERRDEFVRRLDERGVAARPFWQVPHPALDTSQFPNAAAWRERLVALPVHQELGPEDMERVADTVRPPSRPATRLRLERLGALEPLREDWSRLAERTRNVFSSWEWASIWWRHFGEGHPLLTAGCYRGNRLVALLPLYLSSSRPLRVVRFIGHGPGDQLGPICDPADLIPTARALRQWLADHRMRWDLFRGDELPDDEGWDGLLGAGVVERQASPVVRFPDGGWESYLGTLSSRLRYEIRHDARKLSSEHEVGYRLAGDAARLEDDLDVLFRLHAARWNDRDSPFSGFRQPFHRDFARCALGKGWLRLWFLELDGEPVATWYGFRYGDVECSYQTGRDPRWQRSSVGLVLLAHAMRRAVEDGVREYRFLRGDEQYKRRMATEDPGLATVAVGRGPRGKAALGAQAVARRSGTLKAAGAPLKRKLRV